VTRFFVLTLVLLLGCKSKGPDRQQLACVEAECQADAAPLEPHSDARERPLICALDDECPAQQICDGGQCVPVSSEAEQGLCGLGAIYFAFDSAKLTPNNQEQLATAIPCLSELLASGGELILEVPADELSQRRGETVREFLVSMGVPTDRVRVTNGSGREQRVQITHAPP
jgi:outer membrane protein OmpA-like peptidoglycan-associated protein